MNINYISLGSMCYTTTIIPQKSKESLPFDSINGHDNLENVYSVLKRLQENTFDVKDFVGELDEKHINKENFNFLHFNPPKNTTESREGIFIRRFKRLQELLFDDSKKTFIYYNRSKNINKKEFEIVKKIHNLFPNINFIYFIKHNSSFFVENEWFKFYNLNLDSEKLKSDYYFSFKNPPNERCLLLKTIIDFNIFTPEESLILKKRFEKILKEFSY